MNVKGKRWVVLVRWTWGEGEVLGPFREIGQAEGVADGLRMATHVVRGCRVVPVAYQVQVEPDRLIEPADLV